MKPTAVDERTTGRVGPGAGSGLQVHALTKTYGTTTALRDVSVEVPAGTVLGVLGPNGAGKTTLLRAVVGLVRPDAGTVTTFGHPAGSPASLAATGSLIENPAFVPTLSARANLGVLARARGVRAARVEEVLDAVGLAGRGGDQFRAYSLGMGQRLGVAAALLGRPRLLILDEPTSGLDPDGVVAVRELIRALAAEGTTVVFSSHVLTEVERVCDRVLFLRAGVVVADTPVADLRDVATATAVRVVGTPADRVTAVLADLGLRPADPVHPPGPPGARGAAGPADVGVTVTTDLARVPVLVRALVAAGVDVHRVAPVDTDLESVFFALAHAEGTTP